MIKYLKEYLRRALKSLLTDDQSESVSVPPYLDVLLQGKLGPLMKKYFIVGAIGTRLEGIPVDGTSKGVRLIAEMEAVDKRHFQDLWKQHAGKQVKLVWEDTLEEVYPS